MSFDAFESFALPEFIERESAPDALWVFVHIPRTGGSSFIAELAKLRRDPNHLASGSGEGHLSFSPQIGPSAEAFGAELGQREHKGCYAHTDIAQGALI